jgi:hypothetical protein
LVSIVPYVQEPLMPRVRKPTVAAAASTATPKSKATASKRPPRRPRDKAKTVVGDTPTVDTAITAASRLLPDSQVPGATAAHKLKAQRIIENKLKALPSHVLDAARSKTKNKSVFDFVLQELVRIHGGPKSASTRGEYLSTKFWEIFKTEFTFDVSYMDDLSDPEAEKEFDVAPKLFEALGACHAPNPADRKTCLLETFLQYATALNKKEFYGIADASVECLTLTRSFSIKMHVAFARFCARHSHTFLRSQWFHTGSSYNKLSILKPK